MAVPVLVSSVPANGATGVVLGSSVVLTFSEALDPSTVSSRTVSVMGPGQTSLVDADNLIVRSPSPLTGREYIQGTLSVDGSTITFTPSRPWRPNVRYEVVLAGGTGLLGVSGIKSLAGQALASSLRLAFTTGDIAAAEAPASSPVDYVQTLAPWDRPVLSPDQIRMSPQGIPGANLAQTFVLEFPADIDPESFRAEDILVGVEPVLHDPLAVVPSGLQATVAVSGNKLYVTVSGWEE